MNQYQNFILILCKTVKRTLSEKKALSFWWRGGLLLCFTVNALVFFDLAKIDYTVHHH